MGNAHRQLQSGGAAGTDPDRDAVLIARMLHRSGPLDLRDLAHEPGLAGWSRGRVESAVVSAWSHDLIFVDARDRLVAL